jgi:hypothetical protein
MNSPGGANYKLYIPKQAVGADLVYFDLFNASGSGSLLYLLSVQPVVSGAVAVTGVVGVDLHLTRTSAVGTGGTAATREGTDKTAATICALDNSQACHASVTARLTPTGGATAGALLGYGSVFTEETNGGTYTIPADLAKARDNLPTIVIPEGGGIRVIQGAVASVGNIGFEAIFTVWKK